MGNEQNKSGGGHRLGDAGASGASSEDIARSAQERLEKNSHGIDLKKSDAKSKQGMVDRWKTYENIGKKNDDVAPLSTPQDSGSGHKLGGPSSAATSKPKASSGAATSAAVARPWETDEERLAREQRAAKAQGRMKKVKKSTRVDSWKSYQEIDAQQQTKVALLVDFGGAGGGGAGGFAAGSAAPAVAAVATSSSSSAAAAAPAVPQDWSCPACTLTNKAAILKCVMCDTPRPQAPADSSPTKEDEDDLDAEDDEKAAMMMSVEDVIRDAVAQMEQDKAVASIGLLRRILDNLVKAAPGSDGDRFRKIKVKNEKVEALIKTSGALQLLEAVGFERQMVEKDGTLEPYLVFDHAKSVIVAQKVLEQWR